MTGDLSEFAGRVALGYGQGADHSTAQRWALKEQQIFRIDWVALLKDR